MLACVASTGRSVQEAVEICADCIVVQDGQKAILDSMKALAF